MPHGTRFTATATLLLAILMPAVAAQAAPDGAAPAGDATLRAEEEQFDALKTFLKNKQDVEALKREAEKEGDWQLSDDADIPIEQQVLRKPWHRAPFGPRAFDMPVERIARDWDKLMRLMRVPYPSADYLRIRHKKFPDIVNADTFNGDYEQLSRDVLEVWRLFFRGDFQASLKKGETLGVAGRIPGKLSQIIYAIYLEPELDKKHMLLQDAANAVAEYGDALNQMKKEKKYWDDYVMIRVGYAYAIGRIAEDVPIPVAIARNYVFKVMGAANDVNDMAPNHPIGLGFKAGIDANVVRKVGKATGRITFGAKQSDVEEYFKQAFAIAPDVSILRYEYANALMYVNKKRQIDKAMEELRRGAQIRPTYAMEALDAMYAAKRLKEVEALAKSPMSFRSFERKRLKHQKDRNENLYCVLPERCQPFIVK